MEAHQRVIVQTGDITGLNPPIAPLGLVVQGELVDFGVEQHVERCPGSPSTVSESGLTQIFSKNAWLQIRRSESSMLM